MPVGLSVDVGWQWWVVTAIAAAVVVAGLAVLAVVRYSTVRAIAGVLAAEGAVIAVAAPFVMTDMDASGGSALAATGSSMRAGSDTAVIHVVEHAPPPHMQTIGRVMTFANPVFDSGDTRRVGRDQGFCIHITLAKGWECVSTTLLPGGQITNEGPQADNANLSFPAAITGGTGKYRDARGWSTDTPRNKAATKFDLVFHLTG